MYGGKAKMDTIVLVILALIVVLLIILIIMMMNTKGSKGHSEDIRRLGSELKGSVDSSVANMGRLISSNMSERLYALEQRISTLETGNEQKLEQMRETMSKRLFYIQEDNNKKLDEMRSTVDERLQKSLEGKLSESFKTVSEQLAAVYKGLGEMQTIAAGVGDLKKVLSNVKTRGILGEVQLGAILSEILTPEQYEREIPTRPGSREHVEFAVKLPAKESGEFVYLPIDSKFPGDTFAALQNAYASGDSAAINDAYKALEATIKKSAKAIHDKYIEPPYTTSFAIMFFPFEWLYVEIVNHGLVEVLHSESSINIAGPSTMAAMLNSLQMGFQTLQIQKRSNEVWALLSGFKAEFDSFDKVLSSALNRIRQLDEDMTKLVGTRSAAIRKKLDRIELYEDSSKGE